jgi:hypothetical protein
MNDERGAEHESQLPLDHRHDQKIDDVTEKKGSDKKRIIIIGLLVCVTGSEQSRAIGSSCQLQHNFAPHSSSNIKAC